MERTVEQLTRAGWKFKYDSDTFFVSAEHPHGGKITVCEVYNTMHDAGTQIAHCLNQCGQEKEAKDGNVLQKS